MTVRGRHYPRQARMEQTARMHAAGQQRTQAPQPTEEQASAFKVLMQRGGSKLLTHGELVALSEHPNLAPSQRQYWGEQAAKIAMENQS